MAGLIGGLGGETPPPRTLENFRKFWENFLNKIAKRHYFSLFSKKSSKPLVTFLRVRRKNITGREIFEKFLKISDENSIENLNFYLILGMLLLKIEPFVITSFFYNIFSGSGGGGVEPP